MKNPHDIIIRPHITEKTVRLSSGDLRVMDPDEQVRKYTFIVAPDSNKIEIKEAIEAIYNAGKREGGIKVTRVSTMNCHGKRGRRIGHKTPGRKPDYKKAVVTLAKGQIIEEYGV